MRMEPIQAILAAAGVAKPGKNLFMHSMPPEIIEGIVLLPALAGSSISFETPGYRKDAAFQAIIRCSSLVTGIPLAQKVFDALTIKQRTMLPAIPDKNIPEMLVSYIHPQNDPQPYPRMEDNSWEVSINFFMTYAIQGGAV